jgi:predicted DNA binding protein
MKMWNEHKFSTRVKGDSDIHNLINIYRSLKKEEKEVMKRVKQVTRNRKETTLLMSMSDTADYSSLMILAEIGDIQLFRSLKELAS